MLNLLILLMHIDFGSPVKATEIGGNKPIYMADGHDTPTWSEEIIQKLSQFDVVGIHDDAGVICIDAKRK